MTIRVSQTTEMSNRSLVSVIIIFLNAAAFLRDAVESVLAQTYEHWELLLVDDGSTDGSSELARGYASHELVRIRYLEHAGHQNRGMSEARNLGIRHARGDYIAFLDADDYWLPERLDNHTRLLDSYPHAGMLYGSTKYWFGWTGRPEDQERDFVPDLKVGGATLFDPPALLPLLLDGKTEVPCTCSILVRSEIARKIGGFEESFRGMYEDQAFYAKVCLSTPVLATGDCYAWYRQHPESNYSAAINAGQVHVLHFHYLQWLKKYCDDHQVKDAAVLQAIHRQLWLYDGSFRWVFPGVSHRRLRRLKKWILRVEESLVPSKIRARLWMRK